MGDIRGSRRRRYRQLREIKFRAWHPIGRMVYSENHLYGFWKFVDNNELSDKVMQYTGLKDKYGKEIYEGDLIRCSIQGVEQNGLQLVEWSNERGGFTLFYQDGDPYFRIDLNSLEVIGNIYENPELLKREENRNLLEEVL